jgi:hypothetical protein
MKKSISNPNRELRKFSLGLTAILVLIAMAQYFWGSRFFLYFLFAGLVVLLVGLLMPVGMKPVMWLMNRIGGALNWVMTNLILALMFYLVFTLIALFWRLTGHRPLDTKFPDNRKSYWKKRREEEILPQQFEKQY